MILHQFASANLCLCVKLLRQLILPTFPLNYLSQLQLKSFSQTAFASLLGKPGKVSSDVLSNDCLTLIQNRLCFSPDILGIIRKVVEVDVDVEQPGRRTRTSASLCCHDVLIYLWQFMRRRRGNIAKRQERRQESLFIDYLTTS